MALDPSDFKQLIQQTVRETLKQLRTGPPVVASALNTTAAARYLGISPSKLSRLRHEGKGPSFVRIGTAVRFRPENLDLWLEEQRDKEQG